MTDITAPDAITRLRDALGDANHHEGLSVMVKCADLEVVLAAHGAGEGLREALEPVLHWYQSDEHPERPIADIMRDVVADLQEDRAALLASRSSGIDVAALARAFCATPLPVDVAADLCATDAGYQHPRFGTHLLTVGQAEQMFRTIGLHGDVEIDSSGEAMVCTGCGTTRTLAAIKRRSQTAFSCCPERKMVPVRTAIRAPLPTPPSDAGSTTREGGEGVREALLTDQEARAIKLVQQIAHRYKNGSGIMADICRCAMAWMREANQIFTTQSADLVEDVEEPVAPVRRGHPFPSLMIPMGALTSSPDASPDSGGGLRDQIARDAAAFAALPEAEQTALRRELALVGCNPGIVFAPSPEAPANRQEAGQP